MTHETHTRTTKLSETKKIINAPIFKASHKTLCQAARLMLFKEFDLKRLDIKKIVFGLHNLNQKIY
jgi:hypothetical protein